MRLLPIPIINILMNEHERHRRNIDIVCEVIKGKTMACVSDEYGLSAERIRQICNRYLRRAAKRLPIPVTIWHARKEKDIIIEIIRAL
jgi:hypothetical protein